MQVSTILLDSLRHLRSRSLFWISLLLSLLVALALFGMIGFNDRGWHVLWFETNPSPVLRSGTLESRALMSWLFGGVYVYWWLSWGAILLALISTAGIIPDFVAGGSIDNVLSKPIGRLRLFSCKILGALLFMVAQLAVTVPVAYLLMGLRFGLWFHAVWWSIPLLTLQFLYVYAVSAVVGLMTRSPLTSLLAVLLFWGCVSVVQFADNQLEKITAEAQKAVELTGTRVAGVEATAKTHNRPLNPTEQARVDRWHTEIESHRSTVTMLKPWRHPLHAVEGTVPKTGDIQKMIATLVDAPTFNELVLILNGMSPDKLAAMGHIDRDTAEDLQQAGIAGAKAVRRVATLWSIGTSLICTGLVLAVGALIFCRRDF